jgi:Flp pilus assembly protein TadG
VFLLFLFGILEYCRLVYVKQVVDNAAREGARYCVVRTSDSTVITDTQNVVKSFMGNNDTIYTNYKCEVYKADVNGNNIGVPSSAQFGEYVCVSVSLDYEPILPSFLFLGSKFSISNKCCMGSEAN